jgi:hypothetical protein
MGSIYLRFNSHSTMKAIKIRTIDKGQCRSSL